VKVAIILICCALVIIGLTYKGVGAWLRDRERSAERRRTGGGGSTGGGAIP
jgi:hypothetical protein